MAQPESADAHYLLGYILNRRDQADESLREYTTAAKYRRPAANDLAVVALDYVLLKDYADAEKWMTQALIGDPGNALYWYYLGRIRYTINDFGRAGAAFEQALRRAPKDTRDLYNIGLRMKAWERRIRRSASTPRPSQAKRKTQYRMLNPITTWDRCSRERTKPQRRFLCLRGRLRSMASVAILDGLAKAEEQKGDLTASSKELESGCWVCTGYPRSTSSLAVSTRSCIEAAKRNNSSNSAQR